MLIQAELGPPDALQASFEARRQWQVCAMQQAGRYADLEEEAETIVTAAMGRCEQLESEFKATFMRLTVDGTHGFQPEYVDKAVSEQRSKVRGEALGALIEVRYLHSRLKGKSK